MQVSDQSRIVAFLGSPSSYGGAPAVERVETHCAIVFLVGDRAYKLKRAVRFGYLDYSTIELREHFCRRELLVNRRFAPQLYLGAEPIRADAAGEPCFGGDGPVLDWVIVMRRFESGLQLDRLAGAGRLDRETMTRLADVIVRHHADAPSRREGSGRAAMEATLDGLMDEMGRLPPGILDPGLVAAVGVAARASIARQGELLDRRHAGGASRLCHGDLHLRNICLFEGEPTLFDAIEFSDDLAWIDVLYDLAFLLMDLAHGGYDSLGNAVFNRYVDRAQCDVDLAVLPLFIGVRAVIRAMTTAAGALAQGRTVDDEGSAYLSEAMAVLGERKSALVAIGGLSGTGKTTVANAVAPSFGPVPGARVLRSDVIRKSLMGVAPEQRLSDAAYRPEVTARVYATMMERAHAALAAGFCVVLDAVFAQPHERAAAEAVAAAAGRPFAGFWLEGRATVLEQRIVARRGDASDATPAVLRLQLGYDTGQIAWTRVDADRQAAEVAADLVRHRDGAMLLTR